MSKKWILLSTLTGALCAQSVLAQQAAAPPVAQHGAHEWGYGKENGPARWSDLSQEFVGCKMGHVQSPIDIRATKKLQLDPIAFDYHATSPRIIDNGHTIQLNYAPGTGMQVGGIRYELLQFHFHTPSEERIHGKGYPLVAHLVHKNGAGKLGVVAILFKEGKANPVLATVWKQLPRQKGVEAPLEGAGIDLADMLPATRGYYNFMGSLTVPPCSEEVNWFVLKTPVELSSAQLREFRAVYPNNARPVQPLHGHVVTESR